MLAIRREQMGALGKATRQRFEDDLVRRLLDSPGLELNPDQARQLVRAGIPRARRYGFETIGAIKRFIEYMAILKPDFDTDPAYAWAASILNRQEVGPAARITELDRYILFVLRTEEP